VTGLEGLARSIRAKSHLLKEGKLGPRALSVARGFNDLDEAARVEAGAADESAVDVCRRLYAATCSYENRGMSARWLACSTVIPQMLLMNFK
jgi:hypothetical protein